MPIKNHEGRIQEGIVQWLNAQMHIRNFLFTSSLEGLKLHTGQAMKAKRMGMTAGEPDLRLYLDGGRTVFFELKTKSGRLSKAQKDRIKSLMDMGHEVHVIYTDTVNDGIDMMMDALGGKDWGKV